MLIHLMGKSMWQWGRGGQQERGPCRTLHGAKSSEGKGESSAWAGLCASCMFVSVLISCICIYESIFYLSFYVSVNDLYCLIKY